MSGLPVFEVIVIPPGVSLVFAMGAFPEESKPMLTQMPLPLVPFSFAELLATLGTLKRFVLRHVGVVWASQHVGMGSRTSLYIIQVSRAKLLVVFHGTGGFLGTMKSAASKGAGLL